MNLKSGFSRFLEADPGRLHFAAHSHHPWPDVTRDAHIRAWDDAARLADDKWQHVFDDLIPSTQRAVAGVLQIADPSNLVFAPNTQDLVARIFSCFEPPVRVLTTDSEFHSFTRQSRRWEESGLALVDRIPTQPFDTFSERFTREIRAGAHDLIYLSQVFYDSGFVVTDIDRIVSSSPDDRAFIVVDGYHAFMALPVSIGAIQDRVFFIAGGYKYAMAGEGACFMHCPPGYGPRPVDTGWFAGFGQLESGVTDQIPYAGDGSRFAGATYDPSGIHRMAAVLEWLQREEVGPGEIHRHVMNLQNRLLDGVDLSLGELVPNRSFDRGNFLTFESPRAADTYERLHQRGVITDHRGQRLRLGFGVYHDESDVDRLADHLRQVI